MKKLVSVLVVLIMSFSLTACFGGRNADLIEFGGVEWRVLDRQDGRALILSEYLLGGREYHYRLGMAVTWENSDIRSWLNNEFYNYFFTDEERERIIETTVINDDSPFRTISGGNDTIDKIFLLSLTEIMKYFDDDGWDLNEDRVAVFHEDFGGWYNRWWLRSPGTNSDSASWVLSDGAISGQGAMHHQWVGVRPAMWIYI